MAESSKTYHFIPVIIFPSKVYYNSKDSFCLHDRPRANWVKTIRLHSYHGNEG